ncbi:hypothetical protein G6027_06340 [Dietzia sp. SLG310A2-38A2]|uniref:hypothetical protein n=1 Tax=Dietzia sp. SLG310A2-38A2 TaxID=1630643 RepID=UPI0015F966D1|nr:hypothetical protein [Dietzia sp. SLG310A2-38A2]MBB1030506.1 hypothetical protein [Dietzia sp. SLG310A2-38A2]
MTAISNGGTGLDTGAAVYADVPLDYLDTGRELPGITAQSSGAAVEQHETGSAAPVEPDGLSEAFDGAFALLVEHQEGDRTRRRLVVSLAAAERARRRAEERGQRCRVAIVRLSIVAELDRAPLAGGDASWPG